MRQIIGNSQILIILFLLLVSCEIKSAENHDVKTPFMERIKNKYPNANIGVDDSGMYWLSFWGQRDSLDNWFHYVEDKEDSINKISFRYYDKISTEISHLKKFKKLETLIINECNLKEIPSFIFKFQSLENLNLKFNNISVIPKEINKLDKLIHLKLSSNHIKKIPKEIGDITSLVEFTISYNLIEELPNEISNLKNLEGLSLSNNPELKKLP
ncbi:leucine-rich repeat domain-containing protein, partial [Flammeovirga aprica]